MFSDCKYCFCNFWHRSKKSVSTGNWTQLWKIHNFTSVQMSCKQNFYLFFKATSLPTKRYNLFSGTPLITSQILHLFDTKTHKIMYFCHIFVKKHLKKPWMFLKKHIHTFYDWAWRVLTCLWSSKVMIFCVRRRFWDAPMIFLTQTCSLSL